MNRRSPGPLLAALLLALTLAGCSGGGDSSDSSDSGGGGDESSADQAAAAEAVTALADALAAGDLRAAPLADGTSDAPGTAYAAVVEGMGGLTPTVVAGEVRLGPDGGASAMLRWSWPLTASKPWTYAAPVTLTQVGEEWQTEWSPALVEPSLTTGEGLALLSIGAERGDIVGARGLQIVTPRPVVRLGLDRTKVPLAQTAASARRLAVVADIDPAAYVERVEASGPKSFVEAEVYRQSEAPPKVRYAAIPGAVGLFETAPLAPTADFASPLLGTVGEVTAELIADNPGVYEVGDVAGLSGLQERYDAQLRGQPGAVVDAVPASSSGDGEERELVRLPPVPGKPLRLTLDVDLQTAAESILADTAPASGLVAIRPSTGDVLVAANGPGAEGVQISTYGQAAPGSTFKAVSSLALLRAGLTVDSTVPCPPTVTVDGKRFKNYSDYPTGTLGDITLRQAVADSCNTAFIGERGKVGPGALAAAAASLGLGIDHDLGFPAYFGQVPPPAGQTEAAADLIGQGGITASPLVMATVIASIQQGKTVVPRLLEGVAGLDVDVPAGVKPLSPEEGESLRSMLHSVVTDGSGRVLADVPGPPIIAKTGTAEFDADGRTLTHAWMIAAQDDLAVCVYVDRGASGSRTAGPLLEAFLRRAAELTP